MRIGLDISWAQGEASGTASYVQGLVEALVHLPSPHEFVLFTRTRDDARSHAFCERLQNSRVSLRSVDAPLTNLRQQVALPLALRRERLDLYHSPAFFLPLAWRGRSVVSIFDVNFLSLRESWKPGRRLTYLSLALQVPLAAHQAQRVITLSRTSAQSIAQRLHLPTERIDVIPCAPRHLFREAPSAAEIEVMRERYGRFLLCVGVLAPQKNLERLIRALADLSDRTIRLVLVGPTAGDYAQAVLRPLARESHVAERVIFAGKVSDAELRALYHSAEALLFPSLAEGFGLPIVEAMTCGCPVITSDISSMPEVAGEAALLINPYQVFDLVEAMERLLGDTALREQYVRMGRERSQLFTWEQAARLTLESYERAAQ